MLSSPKCELRQFAPGVKSFALVRFAVRGHPRRGLQQEDLLDRFDKPDRPLVDDLVDHALSLFVALNNPVGPQQRQVLGERRLGSCPTFMGPVIKWQRMTMRFSFASSAQSAAASFAGFAIDSPPFFVYNIKEISN